MKRKNGKRKILVDFLVTIRISERSETERYTYSLF